MPAGYRDDMLTCLGLGGGDPYGAARRLVTGVLDLLHEQESVFSGMLASSALAALRDRSLDRYVALTLG